MTLSDTETGRERASGNAERSRWPALPAAAEHSRRTAPSRAAFWLVSCFQIAIVHNASSAAEMGKAQSRPIVRDVVTNRACDRGRRAERDDLSAHMQSQPFPPTSKYSAVCGFLGS
jgi:hypothetical protein